ncbi:hypothetical protein DYB32_000817 [Aphanomyces invadans]|uniref:Uncharacterized protein n=1 Tax=Aphanomyces invadans TaxID=157072 RepID=A0A418B8T3_9STRA|nr:hypothetical protein DYB32_000817 [Aphanomyces invadans]
MDMYHRLGAVDDLVRLFVHDGHVTMALRLALRYASKKQPISHSPQWFFDQVVGATIQRASRQDDVDEAVDETRARGRQHLYALYVFLSAFAPAEIARDDQGRSPLSHTCTFPIELFESNGSLPEGTTADASHVLFRRLFGFPNYT